MVEAEKDADEEKSEGQPFQPREVGFVQRFDGWDDWILLLEGDFGQLGVRKVEVDVRSERENIFDLRLMRFDLLFIGEEVRFQQGGVRFVESSDRVDPQSFDLENPDDEFILSKDLDIELTRSLVGQLLERKGPRPDRVKMDQLENDLAVSVAHVAG